MNRLLNIALTNAVAIAGAVAVANAQQVRTRGHGEPDLDQMIHSALISNPIIITRDTLIKSGDTIRSHVVVVKARFILEGTVIGDLTGFEANIYLRPTARVEGRVLNVAGGLYPSELARLEAVEDRPLAPYRITRTKDGFLIEGTVKRPSVKMLGATRAPEYNRVDGWRVEVGPSLLLPATAGVEPIISGSVGYATARADMLGRAQLLLKRGRSTFGVGWAHDVTDTNDEWIRSNVTNSIAFLVNGKDYRNYYAADRTYVEFRRILERGDRTSEYWVRGQNEIAHPLPARRLFSVFKPDSTRFNPLVPSSRIASAIVGAHSQWTGTTSFYDLSGTLELAGKNGTGADYAFNAYTANAEYAMKAIANHTLHVKGFFRGPLPGTEELPLQRWTFVGGSNTLYTLRLGEFPGDRLAFFENEYRIPLPARVRAPILGAPTLRFMHNIGMAWTRAERRSFEQNIGLRVQFPMAYVRVVTDPKRVSDEVLLDAGLSLPAKGFPWEKPRRKAQTSIK